MVPAPQPPHLSYLYAALSQHFQLVATPSTMPDALRHNRQRLAQNTQTHDWAGVAAVAQDWFEKKAAVLAPKLDTLSGYKLTSASFADELARIRKHHAALSATSAVSY